MARYGVSAPESGGQPLPTIGWIGSPATAHFLHLIAPALHEVVARDLAQVVAVGANAGQLSNLPITVLPWTEATEVTDIQRFDIGIMPLPDAPFEPGQVRLQTHPVYGVWQAGCGVACRGEQHDRA